MRKLVMWFLVALVIAIFASGAVACGGGAGGDLVKHPPTTSDGRLP